MKSSHTYRALRAILASAVISVGIMPIMAHAAAPNVNSLSVDNAPLTPFNSGQAKVSGVATPDVDIDLYALRPSIPAKQCTDSGGIPTTDGGCWVHLLYPDNKHPTHSAPTADSGSGTVAGHFEQLTNLTDFGTHDGTTTTIYLGAVAFSGATRSQMYPIPVIKSSGTANDIYKPKLQISRGGPPGQWCHIASTGADGSCGSTSGSGRDPLLPVCFLPPQKVTTPPVPPETVGPVGGPSPVPVIGPTTTPAVAPTTIATTPKEGPPPTFDGLPCQAPLPNGHAQISGNAIDDYYQNFGHSSEIRDVVITISGGTIHNVYGLDIRKGTSAFFNKSISITDYPPGSYTLTVVAHDAFGTASDTYSKSFTVEPDTI